MTTVGSDVAGVEKMIGVSGSLEDSRQSLAVAQQNSNIFSTVGVHPTRCNEYVPFLSCCDAAPPFLNLQHACTAANG